MGTEDQTYIVPTFSFTTDECFIHLKTCLLLSAGICCVGEIERQDYKFKTITTL